ncbi:MAG TPA: hypothetical protein VGM95_06800 [Lactobacillaceae bacterium]|jgi:hypothetical protein
MFRILAGLMTGAAFAAGAYFVQAESTHNLTTVAHVQTLPETGSEETAGFNFAGQHFDIKPFSGTGHVPVDDKVYAWTGMENWYLIEQRGLAHEYLGAVNIGSKIVVNGKTYHITQILPHQINDTDAAYQAMVAGMKTNTMGFQTCEDKTHLTLYFAK